MAQTITNLEIKKLINEGLSVRVQSNGLVFVGKKILTDRTFTNGKNYRVLREEVFHLVPDQVSNSPSSY